MKTIKLILGLLLVITSTQVNAWNKKVKGNGNVTSIERSTGNYDKIAVAGNFDVTLVEGTEGKLDIKIEDNLTQYLVTEVKNGVLKIKWEKGVQVKTSKGVKITLPFKEIDQVSLGGSGTVKTQDTIDSNELTIEVAGSGNMQLDVKTSNLVAKIAGSGNVKINGNTTNLMCKIAGSGNFNSYGLNTQNTEAKIAGSGNVYTTVNGTLSAKIAGSGSVKYKGEAKTENIKISGSGSVRRK